MSKMSKRCKRSKWEDGIGARGVIRGDCGRGGFVEAAGNPTYTMLNALTHLNYVAVLVTAVGGFLIGWLWYSPWLFAKTWMVEMKITPESIKEKEFNTGKLFGTSFAVTLLSTIGLAALIAAHHSAGALKGAELGAWVGAVIVSSRLINGGLWEQRSLKLNAINVGHDVARFVAEGAVLGGWR